MLTPVFAKEGGGEIGVKEDHTIHLTNQEEWKITEGNVYRVRDNEFIGHAREDCIVDFTGSVLYTFGKPVEEPH